MKTISGNPHIIDESILTSVGKGRENVIKDFLNDTLRATQYTLNQDMSISLHGYVIFKNRIDVPAWVHDCDTVEFLNCGFSELKLPVKAENVWIEDCKKLKRVVAVEGTVIEELVIRRCDNVDLTGLSKAEIKKVKLYQCGITTLKGLENVLRLLSVRDCKKLRIWDLENDNNPILKIEICPIRTFAKPLFSSDVTLGKLNRCNSLEVVIGTVEDLRIEECREIQELKITGNKLDTLVIDNLGALKKVETVDCKSTASFVNLPEIEEYVLPKLSGACVFENVKTIPEVQCKRKIVRK